MSGRTHNMNKVPIEDILRIFEYNPISGQVSNKIARPNLFAGHIYTGAAIKVNGLAISITHIIWVLYYGDWPPDGYWIDHEDKIKAHNWITNLRLATPTQNQYNKAGSGQYAKGVTWRDRKEKPWQAKIRVNGDRLHLGSFATEEEAAKAYREACIRYHGEFACHD